MKLVAPLEADTADNLSEFWKNIFGSETDPDVPKHVFTGSESMHNSNVVYLEKENSQNIDAMIAISLQGYVYIKPSINILRLIEKIKIPMFDIYGSLDFKEGVESAPDRRLASKKSGNYLYSQIEIEGADHMFSNMENNLIQNIIDWVK